MGGLRDMFRLQTVSGEPVTVDGTTVTPQSQALVVHTRFGGFVWNRPVAIQVEERDGQIRRIPIVDVTRVAQLQFLGLVLGAVLAVLLIRRLHASRKGA